MQTDINFISCLNGLLQVFFVESICDDPEIIAENIKVRTTHTVSY